LADGVMPDREGRGYVVRNILRRAQRFGWQYLGRDEPFLYKLVTPVVESMGAAFPELKRHVSRIVNTILEEEGGSLKTLDRGFRLFERAAIDSIAGVVRKKPGISEVKITKTFGLPPKLTFLDSGNRVEFPFELEQQRDFITRYCPETPTISGKTAFDLHTEQG